MTVALSKTQQQQQNAILRSLVMSHALYLCSDEGMMEADNFVNVIPCFGHFNFPETETDKKKAKQNETEDS